jgi:hypothetical protein
MLNSATRRRSGESVMQVGPGAAPLIFHLRADPPRSPREQQADRLLACSRLRLSRGVRRQPPDPLILHAILQC